MKILLKIVYRNLKEHKVKTLIIGIIVAFGMYLLVVGNTVIDTVTSGVSKNFIEYNTGHVAIFPASLENPSLVGGGPEMMDAEVVPIIRDYKRVAARVLEDSRVVAVSPQISSAASVQFHDEGSGFSQLISVDPSLYRAFFPSAINLVEGRFLLSGEEGIVLSVDAVDMLEDTSGESVDIGDLVILTGATEVFGMKIREVPVVGIYDVTIATQMMTSIVDGENMRALNGMTQISDIEAVLTDREQSDLGAVDEDSLFGGGDALVFEEPTPQVELFSALGADRELYNAVDPDSWHYLLIRLEDESQIKRFVREINADFEDLELEVSAYSWIDAAGQMAEMITAFRVVFTVVILIIGIVAIIIIMNTLVISVTERISEIGTMRAIGAQKSFVRRMIILETIVIAIIFGGIGIGLAVITIGVVGAAHIETSNIILQTLAGGAIIRPVLSAGSVVTSLIGMIVAGVFASLYPASLALRIEPRQAIAAAH